MSTLYSGNITIITTKPEKLEKTIIKEIFNYLTRISFPSSAGELLRFVKTMQYPTDEHIITLQNNFFVKVTNNQKFAEQIYKQILKELKLAKRKINESIKYFRNNKERASEYGWTFRWPYQTGVKLATMQPYAIFHTEEEPEIETLPGTYQRFVWEPDLLKKELYVSFITWYSNSIEIY